MAGGGQIVPITARQTRAALMEHPGSNTRHPVQAPSFQGCRLPRLQHGAMTQMTCVLCPVMCVT